MPENTLEILDRALNELQEYKKLKYFEFDVRETNDNVLIVFHDKDTQRMTNKKGSITKLNYTDLSKNYLIWGKYRIPTAEEVIEELNRRSIKPIVVEIKHLHSDESRQRLIDLVTDLKHDHNVSFLAFKNKFKKSFPKSRRKYWCSKMKVVMKAREHKTNLCKPYLD